MKNLKKDWMEAGRKTGWAKASALALL